MQTYHFQNFSVAVSIDDSVEGRGHGQREVVLPVQSYHVQNFDVAVDKDDSVLRGVATGSMTFD